MKSKALKNMKKMQNKCEKMPKKCTVKKNFSLCFWIFDFDDALLVVS